MMAVIASTKALRTMIITAFNPPVPILKVTAHLPLFLKTNYEML